MKIARLILFFCFVVCNSCDSILSKFASTIKWIPRHNYDLKMEKDHPKVLSKKVPLVLSIGFNTDWNLRNRPKPERDETYIVEEDAINFLIKGITISGGSGKLFFREANNVLGREFVAGTQVRKGDTTLFYLPSEGDLCAGHKISISAVLLTLDFEREAGVPQSFSLSLASPVFDCHMKKDRDIFYLEDQKRPIDLCITSNNDIANQQHYKLISYEVSGGRGRLLAQNSNKEVYSGLPLFFGVNNLSYFPEEVGSGEHCLRLLIESKETGRQCNLDYTIPVEDHRIEDFTATVSYIHTDDPLLPFRKSEWILFIKPVNKSGKDLTYQVKNFKIGSGILYFEDKAVDTGTTFTGLENKLILDPASHVGDVGIAMTVVNSKGDEREVTFTHAPIIQSPAFNVAHAIDKETISLPLTSPYRHNKYNWALADYFVSRGLKGIWVDLHSWLLYKCYPLVAGTKRLGDKTGLVLDPAGHSGDLDVAITAASSKGDERVVQFTHRPVIKKPTFKVSTKIEQEKIFLTIHSDYPHHADQWSILDYGILGGMQGDLVDLSGNALKQGAPLKVGDTCFSFKVGELTKVTDHPYLYFRVVQPDGSVCDTPNVDLSYFMLDSLSASIAVLGNNAPNFYTPIVKQYTADPVQAIAKRKSLYDTWLEALQHHARLLSHIQEGVVGDRVGSLLAFLKTLEEDTLNRLNERIYFTEVLHGFHHLFVEFACNDNLKERGSLITSMRKKLADFCRDAKGKLNNASYLSDVVTELGRLEELVKEEDFTAVMSPCSIESPLLSFKKSKWVLHIQPKNESGAKLKYYVKNFKIRCGSLIFNGKSLDNNVQLSSNNEMLLDAEGHTGDLGITITVVNSQGDERTVTFEKKAEIQHPVFSVNTAIDKGRIMLTLTSSHPNAYDKWSLVDYTVSGGIQGVLLDSFEDKIRKDTALQADKNYFSLSVDDVLKTKELPCLRLRVRLPDGVIVTRSIDLSYIVCNALAPYMTQISEQALDFGTPIVTDYKFCPSNAIHSRKQEYTTWLSSVNRIEEIISYMQHGSQNDDASREKDMLDTLQRNTSSKHLNRIEATKLVHDWHDEITLMDASRDVQNREHLANDLKKEISDFKSAISSTSGLSYLSDLDQECARLMSDVSRVETETAQLQEEEKKEVDKSKQAINNTGISRSYTSANNSIFQRKPFFFEQERNSAYIAMQQSFENPLATLPLGGNVLRNTSPKLFIFPKKTGHEQLQVACTRPATLHRGSYTRYMDLDPASRIRKLLFRGIRSRAWLKM